MTAQVNPPDGTDRRQHRRRTEPVSAQAARMAAVAFDGCFGWFHPASKPPVSNLAVLLCPPLGREARWAHRMTRKLADRLAEAGLPVLRFDYPGSGDSQDLPEDHEPLAAWRASIHTAADWLRQQTGAGQLVLIGMRLGALLAAEAAAARDDVAGLALLAPVASGATHGRELKAMARVARYAAVDPAGGIELDGFHLADATLKALAASTLAATAGRAPRRVLLLEAGGGTDAYAAALRERGTELTVTEFEDYAALMRSATGNRIPYAALARTAGWAERLALETGGTTVARPGVPDSVMNLPGCVEQPLRFGPGGHLFGMLCRPAGAPMPEFAVVIGNTGGDPHHGIGRFGVMLSRQLARGGVAALRLDFAGLGDSVRNNDDDAGHIFETDRGPDMAAAMNALSRLGVRRFGVAGLCTGAYHALRAAVADQRIEAAALLNLVAFQWRKGDAVDATNREDRRSTQYYREGLKRADTWRRLLRGQVDVRGILLALGKRAVRRAGSSVGQFVGGMRGGVTFARPRSVMRALSGRGTRVMMLMSFEDSSVDTLEQHFGTNGARFAALPGATLRIERDLDHNLSTRAMRERVSDTLAAFFSDAAGVPMTGAPVPDALPAAQPLGVAAPADGGHAALNPRALEAA